MFDTLKAGRLAYPLGFLVRGGSGGMIVSHQGERKMKHTANRQENVTEMEVT